MDINNILRKKIKIHYMYILLYISFIALIIFICFRLNNDYDIIAILTCIIFIYIGLKEIKKHIEIISYGKKGIDNYTEVNEELKNIIYNSKEGYIFTENYAILIGSDVLICKYEQILMIYRDKYLSNRLGPFESIFLITDDGKRFEFILWSLFSEKNNNFDLENFIKKKNSSVLVGKTKENKKILKEKYGVKKI